ncbi:MAG: hypothetical protein IID61_11405 [SAR324 cluster bacterium]|nr:hypothetical protein [SAR324 cluster bacterium]
MATITPRKAQDGRVTYQAKVRLKGYPHNVNFHPPDRCPSMGLPNGNPNSGRPVYHLD